MECLHEECRLNQYGDCTLGDRKPPLTYYQALRRLQRCVDPDLQRFGFMLLYTTAVQLYSRMLDEGCELVQTYITEEEICDFVFDPRKMFRLPDEIMWELIFPSTTESHTPIYPDLTETYT